MKVLSSSIVWHGRKLRVLAKLYRDNPVPVTFVNRTQADKRVEILKAAGVESWVLGDRPYYVVLPDVPKEEAPTLAPISPEAREILRPEWEKTQEWIREMDQKLDEIRAFMARPITPATPTPDPDMAAELLQALKGLFEHCVMIHKHWGEDCNTKQADAAIKFAMDVIRKADGTEVQR